MNPMLLCLSLVSILNFAAGQLSPEEYRQQQLRDFNFQNIAPNDPSRGFQGGRFTGLIPGDGRNPAQMIDSRVEVIASSKRLEMALLKGGIVSCRSAGTPAPTSLTWVRVHPDGATEDIPLRTQSPRSNVRVEPVSQSEIRLDFARIREEDSGRYRCMGFLPQMEFKDEIEIITFQEINFGLTKATQYGRIYTDAKIYCDVDSIPVADVSWEFNGATVNNENLGDKFDIAQDGILVKNLTLEDEGEYLCRAVVLSRNKNERFPIHFIVTIPPTWLREPFLTEGVRGQDITMPCEAGGKPAPDYLWFKGTMGITPNDRYQVLAGGDLRIRGLTAADGGLYRCVARNMAGELSKSAELIVLEPPRIIELQNRTVDIGEDALLVCEATGNPTPTIKWRKINEYKFYNTGSPQGMKKREVGDRAGDSHDVYTPIELQPDGYEDVDDVDVHAGEDGADEDEPAGLTSKNPDDIEVYMMEGRDNALALRVRSAQRVHLSNYTCFAENKAGIDEKNAKIEVRFQPYFGPQAIRVFYTWMITENRGAPVNLTCFPEAFPHPAMTWRRHGAPVADMEPLYKVYGTYGTSNLRVTPQSVNDFGLYMCEAANDKGSSSLEVTLMRAYSPRQAPILSINQIYPDAIDLAMAPPVEDNVLNVTGYRVYWKRQNDQWESARSATFMIDQQDPLDRNGFRLTRVRVEGLEPGTPYEFAGTALNSAGEGTRSTAISRRTSEASAPQPAEVKSRMDSQYPDKYLLRWVVTSNGGSPINKYMIRWRKINFSNTIPPEIVGHTPWQTVSVEPPGNDEYKVDDLEPQSDYELEMVAYNRIGGSAPTRIQFKTAYGTKPPRPDRVGAAVGQSCNQVLLASVALLSTARLWL